MSIRHVNQLNNYNLKKVPNLPSNVPVGLAC